MKRSQSESWPVRLMIIVWMLLTVAFRQEFNVFAPATDWLGSIGLWPLAETTATITRWLAPLWGNS
jgi:hypothetical protein